jgi:hypothetical protein
MTARIGVGLTMCYFCGEPNEIVMNTRLTEGAAKLAEEVNGKVINMEPCQKCSELMKLGIILITIDPDRSDKDWHKQRNPNPYRTGGFFVLKDSAIRRIFQNDTADWALKHRFMFIEHEAAVQLGFFDMPGVP